MEPLNSARHHSFPCQQCGAQLDYQPGTTLLGCEHCGHGHQIDVSNDPIVEHNFHSTINNLPGAAESATAVTIDCHACSAEFEFDKNLHADECPFCGSRVIVDTTEHRLIQPESVLPFQITDKSAKEFYQKWLKGLWFAPNKLKKYAKKERKLKGVYVPYWTYDCNTHTQYQGQRGDAYTVPRQVSVVINGKRTMRTRMVKKIRWTHVSGQVARAFDDVMVYATDSLPRSIARELAPWDLQNLTPYQDEFLAGFQSEIYKVNLSEGFDIAKERMRPAIRQDIRMNIGGDQQRIHNSETQYSVITFKHILLPFWIAGFRFRNKTYQFIVNGRTGEVQGARPYSWIKIGFAVLLALLLVGAFLAVADLEDILDLVSLLGSY